MTRRSLRALSSGRGGSRQRSGCPANPGTWLGLLDRTRLRAVPLEGEGPTEPSADAGGAECCPKSWPSTCWAGVRGGREGGVGVGTTAFSFRLLFPYGSGTLLSLLRLGSVPVLICCSSWPGAWFITSRKLLVPGQGCLLLSEPMTGHEKIGEILRETIPV